MFFSNEFARQGAATTPQLLTMPTVKVVAKSTGLAGPDFPVSLQTTNVPVNSQVQLTLARPAASSGQSESSIDLTKVVSSPRRTRIGFTAATGGALMLTADVLDWNLKLDTSNLVGRREFVSRVIAGDVTVAQSEQAVALDNQPPEGVRFVGLSERVAVNSRFTFDVTAQSDLTDVRSVQVFIGEMEDGKIPARAKPVNAQRNPRDRGSWNATLKTPAKVGEVVLTAIATNGAGLQTVETRNVNVVTAAELNVGQVRGQVFEGVLRQPNLNVELLNASGVAIARTQTKFDGQFRFQSIPAGDYVLRSAKPGSGRSGAIRVRVVAGQVASGDITLGL